MMAARAVSTSCALLVGHLLLEWWVRATILRFLISLVISLPLSCVWQTWTSTVAIETDADVTYTSKFDPTPSMCPNGTRWGSAATCSLFPAHP
jgi:hypothetical protein